MSKKKHLPEFDPLAGEGKPSQVSDDPIHVPIRDTSETALEETVVAEYKLNQIHPDFFQSRGGVLPRYLRAAEWKN